MFKFLHAADIHLDSPLKGLQRYEGAPADEIRQATRRALINLVDLAMAERVAFVLIAGDLYDGDWKDYNTGLFFIAQMHRLREAGIPVYLIAGNHDAANKMTRSLRLPDNVKLFSSERPETVVRDDLGVALHGQGFAQAAVTENLSASYPSAQRGHFNIGLLHTCANGRDGHERYAPCTVDGLRSKEYEYWALGHVHQREVLLESPHVLFPGNIQGRHIRETGPKGCVVVTVKSTHEVAVDFRPLDVLRWEICNVFANDAADADTVLGRVGDRLRELRQANPLPLAIRVEINGTCPVHDQIQADPQRWTNEVRAAALESGNDDIWIEQVKWRTQRPGQWRPDEGPLGEVMTLLEEWRKDDALLSTLAAELRDVADLERRLTGEIKQGPDGLDLKNPACLRRLLDQVEPVLVQRLLARGGKA